MKKIFNWTFGSIFRTFGRIFAYLCVGILFGFILTKNDFKITDLLGIYRVNAASIPIDNYELIPNGLYYDCTSSGCSSVSTTSDGYETNNNYYPMLVNSNTLTIASNGVAFSYQPYETLKSGYLYNITTYYCSNKDLGLTTKTQFLGQASANATATNYATTNSQSIADVGTFNYCYEIQSLISPKSNVRYISYKMTSSSTISGVYLYSIGFKIKDLGVYTSEIQSIINSALNSATTGLATSNQLNNAVSSIEQSQSENTQQMIDNQNSNTEQQINSQKVCKDIDKNSIKNNNKGLNNQGNEVNLADNGVTDYINIQKGTLKLLNSTDNNNARVCFYDINKTFISCIITLNHAVGELTIPTNASYMKATIYIPQNKPSYEVCQDGNQAISNSVNNLNDTITDNTLNDSDISDSLQFDSVTDNSLGPFATFLTLPLTWVQNILGANQTCRPLSIPLPYLNKDLNLPCMNTFWNSLGLLSTFIQACWLAVVGVRIFNGLFLLTVDTISSKDNEDELTKIKSWEL